MSNIVSDKIVTTRKSHVCSACLIRFDADTKMRAQVNTIGGHIRNGVMANKADALIAFWDGQSRGTKNMIETAKKRNLRIRVVRY